MLPCPSRHWSAECLYTYVGERPEICPYSSERNYSAILTGQLDVTTWSDEELLRGQRRDRNGNWGGRPPKVIPKAIHDEMVKRKMSAAYDILRNNLVEAVQMFVDIAKDTQADPAVRLKAAGMIVDRVLGKSVERTDLSVNEKRRWEVALEHSIVSVINVTLADDPPDELEVGPVDLIVEATAVDDDVDPFDQ